MAQIPGCTHKGAICIDVLPGSAMPAEGDYLVVATLLLYKCNTCDKYLLTKVITQSNIIKADAIEETHVIPSAEDWKLLPDKYRKE